MSRQSSSSSPFDAVRPFMDRALHDEEIRHNVVRAFTAARKVYDELGGRGPLGAASKLSDDERVRDELDTTVQSLSEAIVRMSGEKPKRRSGWGFLLIIAIVLVVLFNPATGSSTRKWLKDTFVGSEEEFDYSTPDY